MSEAIVVEHVSKRFEQVQAVEDISFSVHQGELFGFLGPNGAGKTTTINMLTGLARPDAGTIRVGGVDCTGRPRAAQHLVGVVADESNLHPELTGYENLCFCAALYGMPKAERRRRADELLARFDLDAARDRTFVSYSKGMKRKLTIAAGIIHNPEVLFLDEPTTGIDVSSARQVRQLIHDLHRAGTTIFLTTHYIEEAERLCDRIAFIVAGRIQGTDTVARLLEPLQERHVLRLTCEHAPDDILPRLAAAFPELALSRPEPGQGQTAVQTVFEAVSGAPVPVGPLVRFLEDHGARVLEARRVLPTLEDVFVRVTGLGAEALAGGAGECSMSASAGTNGMGGLA